jgi:peptidyl-prolyl cis-trans isomerase D
MFKKVIASPAMRQRVSWLIAGILILPFIFFFHASGQSPAPGQGGTAGKLFGKPVSWETFEEQRRWLRQSFERQLGGAVPDALLPMVDRFAWDRIMVLREAEREKIRVGDMDVAGVIAKIPAFQRDGRFEPELYQYYVRATGVGPQAFERRVREDLTIEKMMERVKGQVTVSDEDVAAEHLRREQRRTGSYLLFEPSAYASQAEAGLDERALRAFYESHLDAFRVPAQVTVEEAGKPRSAVEPPPAPSDEEVAQYFEDHKAEFVDAEGKPKPLEDSRDEARQRLVNERMDRRMNGIALDLAEALEAGWRWDEVVAAHGLAVRAAGPFPEGNMWAPGAPEPQVMQALQGLPQGQPSAPVTTPAGVFIARTIERAPERIPPFDEVREQVRDQALAERGREAARAEAEAVRARLEEQRAKGVRFEEALAAENRSAAAAGPFRRSDPVGELGQAPALAEAAFAAPLGSLTPVTETPRGFAILRPEEELPPASEMTEEQRAALRDEVLKEHQGRRVAEWQENLRKEANLQSFAPPPPVAAP